MQEERREMIPRRSQWQQETLSHLPPTRLCIIMGRFKCEILQDPAREKSLITLRYMAKAPAAAVDFDGSGQVWFKILDLGPTFGAGTVTWPLARMSPFLVLQS